jgi:Spy/CpxP family protein refolding chaperone
MLAQQGPPPTPPGQGPQAGPPPQGPQLTDDQVLKLQALAKEQRDRLRPATDQARKIREDLNSEFWAEKPDEAKIKQLRADLAKAEQEMLAARLDFQGRRAQVFTPEQRKQMRAAQARRWLAGGRRFPGQGPGGVPAMRPGGPGRGMGPAWRGQRMRRDGLMGPGSGPVEPRRQDEK